MKCTSEEDSLGNEEDPQTVALRSLANTLNGGQNYDASMTDEQFVVCVDLLLAKLELDQLTLVDFKNMFQSCRLALSAGRGRGDRHNLHETL